MQAQTFQKLVHDLLSSTQRHPHQVEIFAPNRSYRRPIGFVMWRCKQLFRVNGELHLAIDCLLVHSADLLAAGADRSEILADFPVLEDRDITAALEYAAKQSDHPVLRVA